MFFQYEAIATQIVSDDNHFLSKRMCTPSDMKRPQDENTRSENHEPVGDNQHHDIPEFFASKPKRQALQLKFGKKSNLIVRNAGHLISLPVEAVYKKFSDLSSHSEWNPNVRSSEYIDAEKTKVRWTRETMGMIIGWTTMTTTQVKNTALVWTSIQGVTMENRVIFHPVDEGKGTLVIMSISYKVPEKVFIPTRRMVGNNQGARAPNNAIESEHIKELLERFGQVVMKEENQT